ncbi:hypothetical protein C6V06_00825 [Burkholderia gladioli]|nr:hypothetical protein EDD84_01905 [Burkholderia gladioli]PRE14398.1 hypothetical protein C6P72_27350 [Burkholderia gladioli]PRE90760.1 hypothetical protein C6Q13_04110 [Burkholderia gladioli]PRG58416.1 hypothetical protein C6V06_00825 [Burkholderia gladioli]
MGGHAYHGARGTRAPGIRSVVNGARNAKYDPENFPIDNWSQFKRPRRRGNFLISLEVRAATQQGAGLRGSRGRTRNVVQSAR